MRLTFHGKFRSAAFRPDFSIGLVFSYKMCLKRIYAKIMQNQIVKSNAIISGGYCLIGIVIEENCEQKVIKTGIFFSH